MAHYLVGKGDSVLYLSPAVSWVLLLMHSHIFYVFPYFGPHLDYIPYFLDNP